MKDLFDDAPEQPSAARRSAEAAPSRRRDAPAPPLAEALRPARLAEIMGQGAALEGSAPLARMIESGRLASLLLHGPPGCGKTSLALALAGEAARPLIALSAVMSGVADLRQAFAQAKKLRAGGATPILFIDEIHRYNKAQQDGLLAEVEKGVVILIGATTENPSFALNAALLSRLHVVVLEALDDDALDAVLQRAEARLGAALPLDDDARRALRRHADGDARKLLNAVELLAKEPSGAPLDAAALSMRLQAPGLRYDRAGDQHFDLISALHKSVRGSDPDAALYWFSRMIEGGEDPRYIARRLVRMASEDIGLAAPEALAQSLAAAEAFERLGPPEGHLALAQAVLALSSAPKSNALYVAAKDAARAAKENGSLAPPAHSVNAPTRWMRSIGRGAGYEYDHDAPERFAGQNYFPPGMARRKFYQPSDQGAEAALGARLEKWDALRAARAAEDAAAADDPEREQAR